jgi:plasmid stabilization system protein ParE
MSFVKQSDTARADLTRLYEFLAQYDVVVAENAIDTIITGLRYIRQYPCSGAPVPNRPNVRKSVVDFGASGYLIFHKYYEHLQKTLISRILHQKEWYDYKTIGLEEEKTEEIKQQTS